MKKFTLLTFSALILLSGCKTIAASDTEMATGCQAAKAYSYKNHASGTSWYAICGGQKYYCYKSSHIWDEQDGHTTCKPVS